MSSTSIQNDLVGIYVQFRRWTNIYKLHIFIIPVSSKRLVFLSNI